jgi:beta-amyrin synthase
MQFLKEKNFKQTIAQVKIEEGEEITYEKATTTLKRAVHFFSALQASDGHWPAENAGPLFFLPPLVSILHLYKNIFAEFPYIYIYIYIYILRTCFSIH